MKNMVVGLTGQTGAGKTTVSEYLRVNGITVIDADKIARDVVGKGSSCIADIVLEFGCEYLNYDGTLNRKKMGEAVFTDKAKLKRLNHVMLPYIMGSINDRVEDLRKKGEGIIVLDAPTLFESGADKNCDKVVSVMAPKEVRIRRIIQRDGLTQEQALHRVSSQHEDEYYRTRSWLVLQNDGDTSKLREETAKMLSTLNSILQSDSEEPEEGKQVKEKPEDREESKAQEQDQEKLEAEHTHKMADTITAK